MTDAAQRSALRHGLSAWSLEELLDLRERVQAAIDGHHLPNGQLSVRATPYCVDPGCERGGCPSCNMAGRTGTGGLCSHCRGMGCVEVVGG